MRPGWGQSGDKPACFEFGNTDRFKAKCHILDIRNQEMGQYPTAIHKERRKEKTGRKDGKGKAKSVMFTPLGTSGNELVNDAIPESHVNVSARKVNLYDVSVESDWESKDWTGERPIVIDT